MEFRLLYSKQSIEEHICKAHAAFFSHGISKAHESSVFKKSCVLPILLYGSESWILNSSLLTKFQSELGKCILKLPKYTCNNIRILALKGLLCVHDCSSTSCILFVQYMQQRTNISKCSSLQIPSTFRCLLAVYCLLTVSNNANFSTQFYVGSLPKNSLRTHNSCHFYCIRLGL